MQWNDLKSMTLEELSEVTALLGEKKYRARQVFDWIHKKGVDSPEKMSNIPRRFLKDLLADHPLYGVSLVESVESEIDGTKKYLFALHDGNVIESVLMKYRHGNSVCISSQAGCRMGCAFCASTLLGLARNLYPSEMLDQIYTIQRLTGERVTHVVVMGTGEPFDNYDALSRMLELVSCEEGLMIGHRNITVSTCGIVPRIYQFADEHPQVTLAISLHAPNDEIRKQLMPISRTYPMEELMRAADYYIDHTGRRLTFEYSLVRGVNDSKEAAQSLCALVRGKNCHVNLIPVNPIKERDYRQSDRSRIQNFQDVLKSNHIQVTVRREMGRDIQAACGQLRKDYRKRSGNG